MVQKYLVRWKNSPSNPVTFFSVIGGQRIDGDFGVREATTFEFQADWQNSDPQFNGFTIQISPNAPDIVVDTGSGNVVRFTNAYSKINARMPLNMKVKTNQNSFVINGGKPIIRNEPHHTILNPTYIMGVIVVLLVVAAIVYFAFFSQ